MVSKKTRVVIVGGGFGGVKAALEFSNKLGIDVRLISDNTHFEYHGALYRSAVGHSPKEVFIPLREIFEDKTNVDLVLDKIGYIDSAKKIVVGIDGEIYKYDKLILALGNTVNYFGIDGLRENTYNINTISETMKLRKKLVGLFSENNRRTIRVAVVGGGATGVELASELPHFSEIVARNHGLPKPKISIILVEGGDRLLPNLKTEVSEKVTKRLIKLGVEIYLKICVQSCNQKGLCLSAGDLNADVIVWTAGSKPVDLYTANPSVFTLSKSGKVCVDEYLRAQNQKDIFVLGDNADTKYSGMAQTAISDAKFVAKNILLDVNHKKMSQYKPSRPLYVVTVGGKWAVVQNGNRVTSGIAGWRVRRKADMWIFKNFEPYYKAIKLWRSGNKPPKYN